MAVILMTPHTSLASDIHIDLSIPLREGRMKDRFKPNVRSIQQGATLLMSGKVGKRRGL
jgi:hypothetical protein